MIKKETNQKPVLIEGCVNEEGYQDYFTKDECPMRLSFHPCNPKNIIRVNSRKCTSYDKCIDFAIKKRWKSFSCEKCPIFSALKNMDKSFTLG